MHVRSIRLCLSILAVSLSLAILSGLSWGKVAGVKPNWRTGASWVVDVEFQKQPPSKPNPLEGFVPGTYTDHVRFLVEGDEVFEGERCTKVKVEGTGVDDVAESGMFSYVLYFRETEVSLKAIQTVMVANGEVVDCERFKGGPVLSGYMGSFPLGFPAFDSVGDLEDMQMNRPPVRQEIEEVTGGRTGGDVGSNGAAKGGRATKEGRPAAKMVIETTRDGRVECTWEAGMPWWTECTEWRDDGRYRCRARLREVDGVPVEKLK